MPSNTSFSSAVRGAVASERLCAIAEEFLSHATLFKRLSNNRARSGAARAPIATNEPFLTGARQGPVRLLM